MLCVEKKQDPKPAPKTDEGKRGAERNWVGPVHKDPGVLEVLRAGAAAAQGNGGSK